MKKVFRILLVAVLCFVALRSSGAFADPKAFDFYGIYDPSGKLAESERAALDAKLEEIYDEHDMSVYLWVLSGEGVSMADFVRKFFADSVAPYAGKIKYGVIFALDMKTNDYFATSFPGVDRVKNAFTVQYLNSAVGSSFSSASSIFEALNNLADALQKRAEEM